MKRFLISSPAFSGEAEIVYDGDGRLVRIDVMNTSMSANVVQLFKARVPASILELEEAFAGSKATIVQADFEVNLDMWWRKYDKKINRKRCEALWDKMNKADQVKAYYGIDAYDKFLKRESWRTKADPETYLRNRYWENEYK